MEEVLVLFELQGSSGPDTLALNQNTDLHQNPLDLPQVVLRHCRIDLERNPGSDQNQVLLVPGPHSLGYLKGQECRSSSV